MVNVGVEPSFFLDLSYRFASTSGLTFIADWFEAAFCAWARDAAKGGAVAFHTAKADLIDPELTNELLHHLLRAWYRISVYQQQLSRNNLPQRPHLFLMLRSLIDHPTADISDLAAGLLVLYQPDMTAEVQALAQAAPSASAPSEPSAPITGGQSTVTALIRAEYELARAAEEAHQQLMQGEATANAQLKDANSNGSDPADVTSVPAPIAAVTVVEHKGQEEGGRATSPSPFPSSSTPSASPVPSLAVSSSLPPAVPASPPSPPSTFTAAFASLACPVCGECFSTDLHTYHHVANDHHLALCTLCALAFPSEELLYAHFETHNHAADSADAPHACGLCGVSFHSEEGLTLHHSVHLIERKAKQQYSKRRKRKAVTEDRTASPSKRTKKGGEEEEEEGGGDDDDGDAGGSGPNRFPPAICSHPSHPTPLCFSSDEDLHAHSVTAHVSWLCFANDCESIFNSAAQLADHIVRVHVLTSRDHISGGPVPPHCPYCGVIWTKKTPRTEHLHRHEKPFHCPKCGMRFARRTRWRNHVKRKHPDDFKRHSAIFEGAKG